jgi:hypothetical protein
LINIHALSGELLAGRFPLYFTGASGHEPLYHWLHAGVHAVLGFSVLGGHLLSVALGVLAIALTFAFASRLFGGTVAVIASSAMTLSFWSLMYSRTAIRHVSLPPFALVTFFLLQRTKPPRMPGRGSRLDDLVPRASLFALLGLVVGGSLYTYPAARLLPVALVLFALYLAVLHRQWFSHCWRGLVLAAALAALLAVPLVVAVARGRSEGAVQGIGADARLSELAVPLRELQAGNPRPFIENTWVTLGMFHASGDSEWLYNLSGRPVFNLSGGVLLWAGVVLCLWRWRQPHCFLLLLWLGLGLLPAFVSTPPASLSHTIMAQPVAYILPALPLVEAGRWLKQRVPGHRIHSSRLVLCILSGLFLVTNGVRDLCDYFVVWPERGIVRFLYRAEYRDVSHYLDVQPEVTDVALSSALMGPWDRLALDVDTRRKDVAVRFFNPERALVWPAGENPAVVRTSWPHPASLIARILEEESLGLPEEVSSRLILYSLSGDALPPARSPVARFANGLDLVEAGWVDGEGLVDQEMVLLTTWLVAAPLDLPPIPIVANPPPPGVYSGPRLAVFTHLFDSDGAAAVDDGLWVDPLTLQVGDRFVQIHRLVVLPDKPGPYVLELGLYDPLTGARWDVLDASGRVVADHVELAGREGSGEGVVPLEIVDPVEGDR